MQKLLLPYLIRVSRGGSTEARIRSRKVGLLQKKKKRKRKGDFEETGRRVLT